MWLWGHEDVLMGSQSPGRDPGIYGKDEVTGSLSLGRDPGVWVGDKDVVMGSGGCGYGVSD